MTKSFISIIILILLCLQAGNSPVFSQSKDLNDVSYRFSMKLPTQWYVYRFDETPEKDAINYTIWTKDTTVKLTLQLMAFKLGTVKNLDDFIYNMEKDVSLNIPQRFGEYTEKDFGKYDMKAGTYKDNSYYEEIYYYRTKMPDATSNYVYMVRFISTLLDAKEATTAQIKAMVDSFKSTVE